MIKTKKLDTRSNMRTEDKNKDFIFEIIHDLKAPIASIDFALESMERNELLDEIYKINKHNLNYVNNMMSGYSLSKGKYRPQNTVINIVKIIKEELRVLNFLITKKNLRVTLSLDKIDDCYIISDIYLVRQIVLNLLANAVKYAPADSNIRILFEKKERFLSICFSNPYDKTITDTRSSKMGLEIIKRKIKALKGKFKTTKANGDICFNICFECG